MAWHDRNFVIALNTRRTLSDIGGGLEGATQRMFFVFFSNN